jgi:hypothetical protein
LFPTFQATALASLMFLSSFFCHNIVIVWGLSTLPQSKKVHLS